MSLSSKVLSMLLSPLGVRRSLPKDPRTLFVLRNNDLGDVVVITPLFAALRKAYPHAKIVAGVGNWAAPILEGNPNIDVILPMNAPWHNKAICRHSANSVAGFIQGLKYIAQSPEVKALKGIGADVGIDVLGSPQGTLLLARAGIPYRVGVRGYAGGDTGCQACVEHHEGAHVAEQVLEQASLLGAKQEPVRRPEIYLSEAEITGGNACWQNVGHRLVIAPGAGILEKRWPLKNYIELAQMARKNDWEIVVIGGPEDRDAGKQIVDAVGSGAQSFAGELSLRESAAIIATSQALACNSSVAMHLGAAFGIHTVVLLGPLFSSASAHAKQWGWPGQLVLGAEPKVRGIATVEEAFDAVQESNRS